MFTVGEFARLGQVSKRLLRYYDEIGLLEPARIDTATDYRYYRAAQLLELNRILALKDLGFSLDEISRITSDEVSVEELRGMLVLKRAEAQRRADAETQRFLNIESRLRMIGDVETGAPLDVLVKEVGARPALTARTTLATFEAGFELFQRVLAVLGSAGVGGLPFAIWHSGGPYEADSDAEMGVLTGELHDPVPVDEGLELRPSTLPSRSMATYVLRGPALDAHRGYGAIGRWVETNGYRFAGPPRELFLEVARSAAGDGAVTEIQYPVVPAPA
jgi:DNA-binding transcriptional MerR regulator